jgi:cell division protein FtsL
MSVIILTCNVITFLGLASLIGIQLKMYKINAATFEILGRRIDAAQERLNDLEMRIVRLSGQLDGLIEIYGLPPNPTPKPEADK